MYEEYFEMSDTTMEHSRAIYSVSDVFGYVGGVQQGIAILLALIFSRYSEQCFSFEAIHKLCLVQAKDKLDKVEFSFIDYISAYLTCSVLKINKRI